MIRKVDLAQVRGIGSKTKQVLARVDVDSLGSLASQDARDLQMRLLQVVDRPPNLAVLEHWIEQARSRTGLGPKSSARTSPHRSMEKNQGGKHGS